MMLAQSTIIKPPLALTALLGALAATATAQVRWDFKNPAGKAFGWFNMHGLSSPTVVPGEGLKVIQTSPDPHLARRNIKLAASAIDRLVITMTITPDAATSPSVESGQFFWQVASEGFSERRSRRFPVNADGQQHRYTLELWSAPEWEGEITALRIDPIDAPTTGTTAITIASVELRALRDEEFTMLDAPVVIGTVDETITASFARETTYTVRLENQQVTSGFGKRVYLRREDVPALRLLAPGEHTLLIDAGSPVDHTAKAKLVVGAAPSP